MAASAPTRKRRTAQSKPVEDLAARTRRTFANLPPDVQDLVRHAAGPSKPNGGAAAPQISATALKKLDPTVRETLRKATDAILTGGPRFADTATAPTLTTSATVKDELERGGPAFGAFIKSVGLGAAAAQKELDQDLVETAKAISATNIDVIAVFEQVIDDNGNLLDGKPHQTKLPLINYLMPTAYQWSRIFLTADMQVSQFSSENGFNIQSHSDNFSSGIRGNASMFGFGVSGFAQGGFSNQSRSGGFSTSQSTAAGQMHLEATLEPRPDVGLPKPLIIQKGPQLRMTINNKSDMLETPPPAPPAVAKVVGQSMIIQCHLNKTDGTPNTGKPIDFRLSEPLITYSTIADPAGGTDSGMTTNTKGDVWILLKREGPAYDKNKVLSAIATVSFGLVTQTLGVQL